MALINNNYFNSRDVKVFPASFRGYGTEQSVAFDPEARLNTEYNYLHSGVGNSNKSTFIKSWQPNGGILTCVIGGYYFEISNVNVTEIAGKYLNIKTREVVLNEESSSGDSRRSTRVLDSWINNTVALDQLDQSTYYFAGLKVTDAEEAGAGASLMAFDANGNPNYGAFLPNIGSGTGYFTESGATTVSSIQIGHNTMASGDSSIAAGVGTIASKEGAIAIGHATEASGKHSTASGEYTRASGEASHAEGRGDSSKYNIASGPATHVEGTFTEATKEGAHAEGHNTKANGVYSHAEGGDTVATDECSHAEGRNTEANGMYAHAEGKYTKAVGEASHSEGGCESAEGSAEQSYNEALGRFSHVEGLDTNTTEGATAAHAEGMHTTAIGAGAHAEGVSAYARGMHSHAEGDRTNASGRGSHAEGLGNFASLGAVSDYSHAEGYLTQAGDTNALETSKYAHSEGEETRAFGQASHAEGHGTKASGKYSHAEGDSAKAEGEASLAVGNTTKASGEGSFASGKETIAEGGFSATFGNHTNTSGEYSIAEGQYTKAIGIASHAEGGCDVATEGEEQKYSEASGKFSHAEGEETKAISEGAHAEGRGTTAGGEIEGNDVGKYAHAEGRGAKASKEAAHAEGTYTEANTIDGHAEGSHTKTTTASSEDKYTYKENEDDEGIDMYGRHAEGCHTEAKAVGAHAEGLNTIASGKGSHASGEDTTAEGLRSTAIGHESKAQGENSVAVGEGVVANNKNEVVIGKYNKYDDNDKRLFVIGSGRKDGDETIRENAFEVLEDSSKEGTAGIDVKIGGISIDNILQRVLNAAYPVGSIYMSTVQNDGNGGRPNTLNTNKRGCPMAEAVGGEWDRIEDTFLYAAKIDDPIYYADQEGGSKDAKLITHSHTAYGSSITQYTTETVTEPESASEEPKKLDLWGEMEDGHLIYGKDYDNGILKVRGMPLGHGGGYSTANQGKLLIDVTHQHKFSIEIPNTETSSVGETDGEGANMPPWKAVYMWKRTK